MLAGLFAALQLHLVPALLAGLLVHELVHVLAPRISFGTGGTTRARMFSVGLIGALVIGALLALGFGILAFFRSEGGSPAALVIRLADILDASRRSMPQWLADLCFRLGAVMKLGVFLRARFFMVSVGLFVPLFC